MFKIKRSSNLLTDRRSRTFGLVAIERLEERIALTAGIAITSATAIGGQAVQVTYDVLETEGNVPFVLSIDRSAKTTFDASAVPITQLTIDSTSDRLVAGVHTILIPSATAIDFDPAHPFVLAVADPASLLAGGDATNQVAAFRIYTIGAVTHGLEFSATDALWVNTAAAGLRADGYDLAVPFFWLDTSSSPIAGQTQAAGARMAAAIVAAAETLPANAIIDLHLIGHSRGSVVISQAMLAIDSLEQTSAIPQLHGLANGFTKMTFLDPHPANNTPSSGNPDALISGSKGPFGRLARQIYDGFQLIAADPAVVIPPGVQDAEVYYQQASYLVAPSPIERIFNLWGENSIAGATHTANLTGTVNGHFEVHNWYVANVIPRLATASPFFAPTPPPVPIPPGPRHPNLYEVQVLFPTEIHQRDTAVSLVNMLNGAETALNAGKSKLATRRFQAIEHLIMKRSNVIEPELGGLALQQIRAILGLLGGA
jgi:hypothetical protein